MEEEIRSHEEVEGWGHTIWGMNGLEIHLADPKIPFARITNLTWPQACLHHSILHIESVEASCIRSGMFQRIAIEKSVAEGGRRADPPSLDDYIALFSIRNKLPTCHWLGNKPRGGIHQLSFLVHKIPQACPIAHVVHM